MCKKIIIVLIMVFLAGCAPTIKKIDTDVMKDFDYRRGFEDGLNEGYNTALSVAKKEYEERLIEFMNKYKEQMLYLQLVKGGIVEPAGVAMELEGGSVTEDGKEYRAPVFKWRIVKEPEFNLNKMTDWVRKDAEAYCYIHLKTFDTYKQALLELAVLEKPKDKLIFADIVKRNFEDRNKYGYSLIIKTRRDDCNEVSDFYRSRKYQVVSEINEQK